MRIIRRYLFDLWVFVVNKWFKEVDEFWVKLSDILYVFLKLLVVLGKLGRIFKVDEINIKMIEDKV